jgi:alpha-tubulin suppressor-like RCC1 family protein
MPVNSIHSIVLSAEKDQYYAIGCNHLGQLGTDDNISRNAFVQVNTPVKFFSISAGVDHNLAISELDGSLWAWGANTFGQLGFPKLTTQLQVPTQVPNTENFTQISTGAGFSLALNAQGDVWAFGINRNGEIAQPVSVPCLFTPTRINSLSNIATISAGENHGLALGLNGEVWSFGSKKDGKLGTGRRFANQHSPVKISNLQNIIQISSGFDHNLAIDSNYQVWSWGNNNFGQLGLGDTNSRNVPEKIPTLDNIEKAVCGGNSSFAFTFDKQVFLFGSNRYQQFAFYMSNPDTTVPVAKPDWTNWDLIPGADHTIAISDQGLVYFFGFTEINTPVGRHQQEIKIAKISPVKKALSTNHQPQETE